jgi:hypothetical protein
VTHPAPTRFSAGRAPIPIQQVEGREWWLWGFAVVVTLVLTLGIVALTFPGLHLSTDDSYSHILKEWVRGLAALVLLFDIYTVYQHLQLQRIRRRLMERERLFHLITENAADMIAVVDTDGKLRKNTRIQPRRIGCHFLHRTGPSRRSGARFTSRSESPFDGLRGSSRIPHAPPRWLVART